MVTTRLENLTYGVQAEETHDAIPLSALIEVKEESLLDSSGQVVNALHDLLDGV